MKKLHKSLLWVYFWILNILYILGAFYTVTLVCRGLLDIWVAITFAFTDVSFSVHSFSHGVYQIIVSFCFVGLIYILMIGSALSPFYTKKLIGNNSKLPIGRRKN